ncbi:hypothetical protein PoB_002604500 [Plakobranchus ocellatus]|uniref:Uncharacterized protein n=1 Tax=Plakobranchus ocellatus TaxID=259542 RepID=A0AAV3ZWI1_9GAST|nr:hypothetical protein PoB_002604500 [Plakobranchus ocellatus]
MLGCPWRPSNPQKKGSCRAQFDFVTSCATNAPLSSPQQGDLRLSSPLQAKARMAGPEPTTEGFLQMPRRMCFPLCHQRPYLIEELALFK